MKEEDIIKVLKHIQNKAQNLNDELISCSVDRESKVNDAEWFCDYLDLEIDKLIRCIKGEMKNEGLFDDYYDYEDEDTRGR